MNEHAKVMAQHLTQNLVGLGGLFLRTDRSAELPLQHGERTFYIMNKHKARGKINITTDPHRGQMLADVEGEIARAASRIADLQSSARFIQQQVSKGEPFPERWLQESTTNQRATQFSGQGQSFMGKQAFTGKAADFRHYHAVG
jgi:hypothetical protein